MKWAKMDLKMEPAFDKTIEWIKHLGKLGSHLSSLGYNSSSEKWGEYWDSVKLAVVRTNLENSVKALETIESSTKGRDCVHWYFLW